MKNELKISILSIACVLCTTMAMPALGASSVRSLGGAGTYASASSAASAKSGANGGSAINSVRGGSMRVNTSTNNASGSTRTSTSRATTTPRLSIGKYLAGSSAVSGGSSDKVEGELSQLTGNLQQRIRILEQFMGYSSTGDDIPEQFEAIQVDIEKLKDDVAALSAGEVTDVTYEDGVLTVVNGGDEMTYDLSKDFAGMSEIAALETALDDLESKLADYAKLSDLDGLLTSADLSELEDAIDALELVDASMDSAIKALQGGMVTKEDLNAKVSELSQVDAGLQAAIDALKNTMPSTEGLVNKDYVDNAVAGLESADAALQDAIDAIVRPDVDKAYVDAAIAGLNTAITELRAADTSMGQAIADLQSRMANVATRDDIKDFVTSDYVTDAIKDLATKSDIQDFVKSGDFQAEIAKLATKEQIADFVTSDVVTKSIADATKDLLTADDVADFVTSGDMAAAITNATSDLVTTAELNTAKSELQAAIDKISAGDIDLTNYYTKAEAEAKFATKAEIPSVDGFVKSADLAAVATSGSYDDLSGKPTIPSIEGLASESYVTSALASKADASALADAVADLQALIDDKQAAGDYLVAADLATLEAAVAALDSDKADTSTVAALQSAVDNLGDKYATDSEISAAVAAVEAKIPTVPTVVSAFTNDAGYITDAALTDYAKSADVTSALASRADASALADAVDALEAADSAMDVAIKALQGGMITEGDLNAKVSELTQADKALQDALAELEANMPSIEGLAEKTYVDGLVSSLELADSALQSAIDAIEKPDVNKAYVDAAIADLNTAITGLQAADTSMGQTVESLQASLNSMATKQELADVKSELQAAIDGINAGDVELTNYYTKAEADAQFATKDELAAKQDTLTPGAGITITDNTISATVDTSSLITKPAEQPTEFGEYMLILNINEAGVSEGYSWLDTKDFMGGDGFDM